MAGPQTLSPDVLRANGGWTRTNASAGTTGTSDATVLAAVNDATDNTFVRRTASSGSTQLWVGLADLATAPTSGEFISYVTMRVRMSQGSGGVSQAVLYTTSNANFGFQSISGAIGRNGLSISTYTRSSGSSSLSVTTTYTHQLAVNDWVVLEGLTGTSVNGAYQVATVPTAYTFTVTTGSTTAASATNTGNASKPANQDFIYYKDLYTTDGLWTQTHVTDLTLAVFDKTSSGSNTQRPRFFDVQAIVQISTLPAFAVAPTFTNTNSTRPTISLGAYSQADGFAQNGVQVRIFSATKTDPSDNTSLVWDSGVLGNVTSVVPTVDLGSGTYYVYARTGCDPSNGANGLRKWSAWGSGTATSTGTMTVSLTPPTTPTLGTATWNSGNQTVSLTATGAAFATGTQVFEFQRSNDSGTTWYQVRGGSALTPNGSYAASVTDYEAARNKTVQYRVRSVGTVTSGGYRVTSALAYTGAGGGAAAHPVTTVTAGGGWTLRAFNTSSLLREALDVRVLSDVSLTQEEPVGVFRPLGRSAPIVVHGTMQGNDGEFQIITKGDTEWTNVHSVVNSQRLCLVLDPFGGYRYVRFISRDWVHSGTYDNPIRTVRASYVEVQGDAIAYDTAGTTIGSGYQSATDAP